LLDSLLQERIMVDFRSFDLSKLKLNLKLENFNIGENEKQAFKLIKSTVLNSSIWNQGLTLTAQYLLQNKLPQYLDQHKELRKQVDLTFGPDFETDFNQLLLPISTAVSALLGSQLLVNNSLYTSLLIYPSSFHWHARAILATYLTVDAMLVNLEEPIANMLQTVQIIHPHETKGSGCITLTGNESPDVDAKNTYEEKDNYTIKINIGNGSVEIS